MTWIIVFFVVVFFVFFAGFLATCVYTRPSLPVPQEAQEGGEPERGGSQSDCRFARPFLHAGESADVSRHADAAQLSGHARLKPCLRYHSPAPASDSVHFMICFVFVLSRYKLVPLLISHISVFLFFKKKRKFFCFLFKNKVKHLGRREGGGALGQRPAHVTEQEAR